MNTKDYISLLNKPYSLNERQTQELENILMDFPYLQSARALMLKGLYNMDSFRYNTELKKAAAHTTDRSVLFEFITSEQFQSIEKDFFEASEKAVSELTVKEAEVVAPAVNKLEESIKAGATRGASTCRTASPRPFCRRSSGWPGNKA